MNRCLKDSAMVATENFNNRTSCSPEDDLASLALPIQQLLSLAAETDLLQHMKRLASCTMVHKTQDKLSLELLKEFLKYACGLKLQQGCFIKSPSVRKIVEDVPWRSITNSSELLNPQHIQPAENSAVLLMLLRSCQQKGHDPNTVLMFLKKSLLSKYPDGEEVTQDTSTKEQPVDDGWFIYQRILLPKHSQKNIENKKEFNSHFTDLRHPEKQDTEKKKEKLIPVFNSVMMLPRLLQEEEEKMLLQSLQIMSKEERIEFLRQHGLLQDKQHAPFIPGLSEQLHGLWTEPKAFKVHHKEVFTRPMSPFSKDRLYNIRSLKTNFQVHKSDRELTQFMKIHLPQIPLDKSPLDGTRDTEYRRRQQPPSNTQPVFPPHRDNFNESYQTQRPQQERINDTTVQGQERSPAGLTVDGDQRQPGSLQESSVRINSSNMNEMKRRKLSRGDTEIPLSQQKNLPEVNQMQEKNSHKKVASQSNLNPGFEDNHQMDNYPKEETLLLSTTSFQSTTFFEDEILQGLHPSTKAASRPTSKKVQRDDENKRKEGKQKLEKKKANISVQRENDSGLKDRVSYTMQITSDQQEPDSLVYLNTSTQRTKSPPIQLIVWKPDTFEPCKDESLLKTEKPPDDGDDRRANEKAEEVIVTKKEERGNLPRAVFTKRKLLPNIKGHPWKNSQKARIMMEEAPRLRPSIPDFLTKYCIIKPERLSLYERVFLKYCSHEDTEITGNQKSTETSKTNSNCIPGGFDHVEEIFIQHKAKENIDIRRKIQMILESGSVSDQLEKIQFQMKMLLERKKHIVDTIQNLQDHRTQFLSTMNDRQSHATRQKVQKKRKKMKGTKLLQDVEEKEDNPCGFPSSGLPIPLGVPLKEAEACKQIEYLDLKIKLFRNKSKEINSRLSELNEVRRVLEHKHKEDNLEAIIQNSKIPPEKRRLQSALYRRLHPDKDLALDPTDLEEALQDVNKCLVSPKEFSYIFHMKDRLYKIIFEAEVTRKQNGTTIYSLRIILELPGQYRLNLELFCVIAALSEKVTQLDPVIKKLINKLDFEALSVRIEKAKELWHLLQEDKGEKGRRTNRRSQGSVSIHSLALELAAGGFSWEAINVALKKFNRMDAGGLSFLDFVTYIPLFVEIHESIVENPLSCISNVVPVLEDRLGIHSNSNSSSATRQSQAM